jgi:hypothetical protein
MLAAGVAGTFPVPQSQQVPRDVAVVDIDQASFEDPALFGARRPLDADVLATLIDDVAKAGPALIAIDISTSDPSFRALRPRSSWPPIVWGQEIVPARSGCAAATCAYRPLPVLGGTRHVPDGAACGRAFPACAAIPVRVGDRDSIGRRYERTIAIPGLEGRPAFPWAIVERCAALVKPIADCVRASQHAADAGRDPLLRFRYDDSWPGMRYSAETVVSEANAHPDAWVRDPALHGHIVLIGGTYGGEDRHATTGAVRPGLLINAHIIEDELAP